MRDKKKLIEIKPKTFKVLSKAAAKSDQKTLKPFIENLLDEFADNYEKNAKLYINK